MIGANETRNRVMSPAPSDDAPQRVGFFLVPGFSMMALSAATEPLRAANRVSGRQVYSWPLLSADGQEVSSSSGFRLVPEFSIREGGELSLLIVVSSLDVTEFRDQRVFAWLRRLALSNCRLGAVSTGTLLLARAGVLNGYRCTIHWELRRDFAEEFPDIEITRDLFCIDRNRVTCGGGTAALDLMLALIAERHGQLIAAEVAEQFLHTRIRPPGESQRMPVQWRYGITDRRMVRVINLMEQNIEHPLHTQTLAQIAGISRRQLERRFLSDFGKTPSRFYVELRLKHAQMLLLQSTGSLLDVALKCGFSSASHFGRCFRATYHETPARVRRVGRPDGRAQFGAAL
jgi:transcriptional regulator GlxA family with amidase domain